MLHPVHRVDFYHLLTYLERTGRWKSERGGCSEEALPGDVARRRTGDGFTGNSGNGRTEEREGGAIERGREGGGGGWMEGRIVCDSDDTAAAVD